MKNMWDKVGVWSFIAGLAIAAIASLIWGINKNVILVLGVLGIVVALINITSKEAMMYLLASVALIIGSSGLSEVIKAANVGVAFLESFLTAIVIFVAPGAVVVAIKAIFDLAKGK